MKIKPSIEEIKSYAIELGLVADDGEAIYDNWLDNGWTRGGRPIQDWKACMRNWKRYGYFPSQKNGRKPSVNEEDYLL